MKKVITVLVIVCSTLSLFAQNETKTENSKKAEELWKYNGYSVYTNHMVNINTTQPGAELNVGGDFRFLGGATSIYSNAASGNIFISSYDYPFQPGYSFRHNTGTNFGGFNMYASNSNQYYFYIGSSYDNNIIEFHPNGNVEVKEKLKATTVEATNYIGIKEGLWSERAPGTILYNGNVGINTSDPMEPLHVEGNTYVNGQLKIWNNQDEEIATFNSTAQGGKGVKIKGGLEYLNIFDSQNNKKFSVDFYATNIYNKLKTFDEFIANGNATFNDDITLNGNFSLKVRWKS